MKVTQFNEKLDARLRKSFNALRKNNFLNAKSTFLTELLKDEPPVRILFKPTAWVKMHTLVKKSTKEIGWHCICEKIKETVVIKDILVYPQEVTSVTVSADEEKYGLWMHQLPDEIFNNLRGHGHSHVNMGTSPSGTDLSFYQKILEQLGPTDYYIFFIVNKTGDINVIYYDMEQGLLYEKDDVIVDVLVDETSADPWYDNVAQLVKDKPIKKYTPLPPKETKKYKSTYLDEQYDDIDAYLDSKIWEAHYDRFK